jgi:hypothetical protein
MLAALHSSALRTRDGQLRFTWRSEGLAHRPSLHKRGVIWRCGRQIEGRSMLCTQCQSSNRREFPTEMMIHNGSNGAIPDLLTFPRAWVCFECGYSTFTLAQNELLGLREACMTQPTIPTAGKVQILGSPNGRQRNSLFPDSQQPEQQPR